MVRSQIGFGGRADLTDGLETRIMGEGSRLRLEWGCWFLWPRETLRDLWCTLFMTLLGGCRPWEKWAGWGVLWAPDAWILSLRNQWLVPVTNGAGESGRVGMAVTGNQESHLLVGFTIIIEPFDDRTPTIANPILHFR